MDNPWADEPARGGEWDTAWTITRPPDHEEHEKIDATQPTELLVDSLIRQCREIWPADDIDGGEDWKSGFSEHPDIIALLAQLLPTDSALPPAVQFSATATAKAMNEALKLTRHLPAAASSPLSRLLASKGSLEWEKSIRVGQDIAPDTTYVGWRVLDKEDRLDESKPRKATVGLLSFWNRRVSTVPVETPRERSSSPARTSQETPSSRAASPPKISTTPVPPTPPADTTTTVAAPSAVSRFLNRFTRTRGAQHSALALSSDDLEFLSDIVPSASDPPDEDIGDGLLDPLTGASNSSPLPPKLPPPIPPPLKQPMLSRRPSSVLGPGVSDGAALQVHAANVPVLVPPLSPKPAVSLPRAQSPPLGVATPTVAPTMPPIQQILRPCSRLQSSLTHPPPQKTPSFLSIPPLLPPPPVSPPQTPRPTIFPSKAGSSTALNTSSSHDSDGSDDEFSAFASFPPPPPAPFPSSEPYPSQDPPSPPSPPPRRSYERTHYPSSSSASSMLSPESQSSLDRLYSTRSSISTSLDGFDDFVRSEHRKRTPSPPPLPVKSQLQHQQPLRLDTSSTRAYHAHTPSQTAFASPTVHTSLMHNTFSPSVSDAEHGRTQSLVNQAAARGGVLWPNSPDADEPKVKTIPPPPQSTSTSPTQLIGQDGFDLLGDGDTLGGKFEALPAPVSVVTDASRALFGTASGLHMGNRLQPSLPPPSSTSTILSLGTPVVMGTLQPTRQKQTGGLSAQDLSFFEGL